MNEFTNIRLSSITNILFSSAVPASIEEKAGTPLKI